MTQIIPTQQPIHYQLSQSGDIFATGQTVVGDITATIATIVQSDDQNEFLRLLQGDSGSYPPLPETGEWCEEKQLYSYAGACVLCRQSHARTIYPPQDTPALFSVYRSSGDTTLEWIANESIMVGNIREYNTINYRCIQAHVTQLGWEPPNTLALWIVDIPIVPGEWAIGVAYVIDDTAVYSGTDYICIQNHVSQRGWEPPNVPALWNVKQTENWQAVVSYAVNDEVSYLGLLYQCLQAHTSQVGWQPPNVPALWLLL